MMKYSFFFVTFLVSFNSSFSQIFWEPLFFPDTAVEIRCISTNKQGHIFVGTGEYGAYGALYRTIDTAKTWDIVFNGGTNAINNIAINDSGYIFISKQTVNDRLYVSKNNCSSWEQVSLPIISTDNVTSLVTYGIDTIYLSSWEWDVGGLLIRSIDGGENWDSLFSCNEPNSYISDISVSCSGKIYISILGFVINSGGVYVSEDDGLTWNMQGLVNHQVKALSVNSNNEIFAGDWYTVNSDPPGLFALYYGNTQFELLKHAYHIDDIAINSEGVLFLAEDGNILRSEDNGQSFENISFGATGSSIFHFDNNEYLFAARINGISRSNQSTITSVDTHEYYSSNNGFNIYPNPTHDIINVEWFFIPQESNFWETKISIYNAQGKLLFSDVYEIIKPISINIGFLSPGNYLIKLANENVCVMSTLIIK